MQDKTPQSAAYTRPGGRFDRLMDEHESSREAQTPKTDTLSAAMSAWTGRPYGSEDPIPSSQQDDTAVSVSMMRESNLRMLAAGAPYRFGESTLCLLDDETLETIGRALQDSSALWIDELYGFDAELASTRLWAIDHACRALGLES